MILTCQFHLVGVQDEEKEGCLLQGPIDNGEANCDMAVTAEVDFTVYFLFMIGVVEYMESALSITREKKLLICVFCATKIRWMY